MILLPILRRELRARGQSSAHRWGRVAVATVAALVTVPPLAFAGAGLGLGTAGRGAFNALVSAAFLLCCGACLLTADAISRERREGTLSLVLLTDVSHWDILLGKFASIGLASFTGLLAFVPLLALPMLTGGTTAGEVARSALALGNTLFLAVAAGLCVSSVGYDRFRTSCAAVAVMVAVVLAPVLIGNFVGLASPLSTIKVSADTGYRASPHSYWISLGLVQAFAWGLLAYAVVGMRKPAEELLYTGMANAEKQTSEKGGVMPRGETQTTVQCRYCGRRNQVGAIHCYECGTELFPKTVEPPKWTLASAPSAMHWLLDRQRGTEPVLWIAAAIAACQVAVPILGTRLFGATGPMFFGMFWGLGLFFMGIAGALIAFSASRHTVEARRDGTLELLLTTPLGAEALVATEWELLKRKIRLPLLVMLSPSLLQGFAMLFAAYHGGDLWRTGFVLSVLLGIAGTILSVAALSWVALWLAFSGMAQGRLIFWTVLVAHGLPYVLSLGWALIVFPLGRSILHPLLGLVVPQSLVLLFYVILIRTARSYLLGRPGATGFDLSTGWAWAMRNISAAIRHARQWPMN